MSDRVLYAWRHPRPVGTDGRCIGRTDLAVDARKARRLARRIERFAAAHGLLRVVATSPLRRCADVGRLLRREGWVHLIDPQLLEMDFGAWEGRAWDAIPRAEIDAWVDDFVAYLPGGGESLGELLDRARLWRGDGIGAVVGHAGWISARRWLSDHPARSPTAGEWPRSAAYAAGPLLLAACPTVATPRAPRHFEGE